MSFIYCMEYDYDDYSCYGCYGCESGDDYCRGSQFEGLRITEVNLDAVARYIIGDLTGRSRYDNSMSPALVANVSSRLEELGIANPDAWEIYGEPDYYGDNAAAELLHKDSIYKEVTELLLQHSDNEDADGIYKYCRSKGQVTTGLTPLEAIRAQLSAENGNKYSKHVYEAARVYTQRIELDKIHIGAKKHFATCDPRKMLASQGKLIAGVLAKVGNEYHMVDGYHRLKWLTENQRKSATYIVLEK